MLQRKSQAPTGDSGKNQWTVETLREHLLAIIITNDAKYSERFEASQSAINAAFLAQQTAMQTALTAQKTATDTALASADRAVTKAEVAADKRFEGVNEFRETLADQQRTLMPRAEAELLFRQLTEKYENVMREIAGLRESRSEVTGTKIGSNQIIAYLLAAAGVALALISFLTR
jgi:hypothetical protein